MAKGDKPYFKHELDAYRHPKMVALRLAGHADAEPFFWAVLCYVHESRCALDMGSVDFIGFCHTMCCAPDAAREQIGYLAEVDLLYVEGDTVSSHSADETVAEWDAKSAVRAEAGSRGGSKRKQTQANGKQTQASASKPKQTGSKRKQTQAELEQELEQELEEEQEQKGVSAQARAPRRKHGEYGNVLLSDGELEKLKAEFPADWQQRIERLDGYIASTGKRYKSHLATIRNWAKRDAEQGRASPAASGSKVYGIAGDGEGWMPE